jgi:hypothetical protein
MVSRALRQASFRSMLAVGPELIPGMPAYLRHARAFIPLEIPLGQDQSTLESVVWEPGRESNGFFLILGSSGSGKTETLKTIGARIAERAFPVLVLDFHGDVNFPGVNSVLLSSGTASTIGFNPMELDCEDERMVGLYDQRMALVEMLKRAIPRMSHNQQVVLLDAITQAYQAAGIHDDRPATWGYRPPTFPDVLATLRAWAVDPRKKSTHPSMPGCINAIRSLFDHPLFRKNRHLSLEELLTCNLRLDLSKLSDEVRYVVAETVLRKLFFALRLRGDIAGARDDADRFRIFIIIDEAKILSMGKGDKEARDRILNLLMTEGRKFGIALILASQMSSHFTSEIRANAAVWLVLKPMDMCEAKVNAPNIQVSPTALVKLQGRGEGFLRSQGVPQARLIQVASLTA